MCNSLTIRHSLRKSFDKRHTFDPLLRLTWAAKLFLLLDLFFAGALQFALSTRRNLLFCGCFDRFKKPKSGKGGGGILFLPDSRVPSLLAREGTAPPPPTSSKISILKTLLLTQEAFFGDPWTVDYQSARTRKCFVEPSIPSRRRVGQLACKVRTRPKAGVFQASSL